MLQNPNILIINRTLKTPQLPPFCRFNEETPKPQLPFISLFPCSFACLLAGFPSSPEPHLPPVIPLSSVRVDGGWGASAPFLSFLPNGVIVVLVDHCEPRDYWRIVAEVLCASGPFSLPCSHLSLSPR